MNIKEKMMMDYIKYVNIKQGTKSNKRFSWNDDGFPGDEDNGTMAAWYVFAVLGIYPLCPGKNEFVSFKPLCREYMITDERCIFKVR